MKQKQLFSQHFAKRINLNQIEMLDLVNKVVTAYNLGDLKTAEGIEVGYEDVNFILTTTMGKYLLKVLIDFTIKKPRSEENSKKYVDTMEQLRADKEIAWVPPIESLPLASLRLNPVESSSTVPYPALCP